MRLVLSIVGNAVALFATTVVSGITFTGTWVQLALAGAIFGLLNFFVKPLALILSLPALVLTLGLFYLFVNGALLYLAAALTPGFQLAGFGSAVLGAIVISVVGMLLGGLVEQDD